MVSDLKQTKKGEPSVSYDDLINKDILDLLGVKEMSDEDRNALYRQMMQTIQFRVLKRAEDFLADEEIDQLNEYIDKNDRAAFEELAKGIDIGVLYAEETLSYKAELLNHIQGKRSKEE